jgi:hypothetical protein
MQNHPKATIELIKRAKSVKGLGPEATRQSSYIILQLTKREREDEDVRLLTDSLRRIMREHDLNTERR